MARTETEHIGREIAKSLFINWGTTAPFQVIGEIYIQKIGYAGIPIIGIKIACKDCRDLVAIARQMIYRELEVCGLESEIIEFTPTVGSENQGRRYKFTDTNESSLTLGKNKYGILYHFHFEIKKVHVGHFEWGGFCNQYGALPHRPES